MCLHVCVGGGEGGMIQNHLQTTIHICYQYQLPFFRMLVITACPLACPQVGVVRVQSTRHSICPIFHCIQII